MQVNMHEAKSQLSALGKKAWAGERIVIARAGEPYLDLLPHKIEQNPRKPGRFKGKIRMSSDFTETPSEIIESFYGEEG
ncbi:MAG: type II toxin-antitoxin system prevent-host-death family antitoxin [Thermodesulfobacteriota bacterium]|nr:type II toxin-antitoxin system prevent-host-death family antitoxin [Thermodesulfobacteriota bacterium]